MLTLAAVTSTLPVESRISTLVKTTGENQPSEAPPELIVPLSPGSAMANARSRSGVQASRIGSAHMSKA